MAQQTISTTKVKPKKTIVSIPNLTAIQLDNALIRLGFQRKKSHNHQYKYKHPTLKPKWGNKACVVFPEDIGKRKVLQQLVIKQISANFDIPIEKVIASIK